MIQRRAPIRRTPLKRGSYGLKRSAISRTPGRKSLREAGAIEEFRRVLLTRSGGWCEVRTPACRSGMHAGADPHHLCPADRDRGDHDPERGRYVCRPSHRWIHAHPILAYRHGWLIRDAGTTRTVTKPDVL